MVRQIWTHQTLGSNFVGKKINYLNGKSVYLCGAMQGYDDSGAAWRDMITPHLVKMGITVADPTKLTANGVGEVGDDKKRFRELVMGEYWSDLKNEADFLICYYNPLIPTIGTIHELVNATNQKKPILLKYDKEHLSHFNPWMCCLIKNQYFHNSWESLLSHLESINDGNFDTSYWTL
jgi:hypothetical protein